MLAARLGTLLTDVIPDESRGPFFAQLAPRMRPLAVGAGEYIIHEGELNVNAIAPGAFSSEMMDGMLERMGDFSTAFPRGRIGDPAQMDSSLLYFVSPASEFVTGTYVKIDDGQGAR